MCCPLMDLAPQKIFSKSIFLYINSDQLIYIIICVAIVLVNFNTAQFTG